MPNIFDNIQAHLLPSLNSTINLAYRADYCVGYFSLRGWGRLDPGVDHWLEGNQCRILVGMALEPDQGVRDEYSVLERPDIDQVTAIRLKRELAQKFREQLAAGVPTNQDEATLRRLSAQLRAGKVVIKLFLRYPLHAKLYLLFRDDPNVKIVGYLGSSNLTVAGLDRQGELNVDVVEADAANKLAHWFEDRWNDRLSMDISQELADIIDQSWARADPVPPYLVYLKIAYHLAQEARDGISEFRIPEVFRGVLLEFQAKAVQIAAHHVQKREGVLIGDVVGLGKTLIAAAVARVFEDDYGFNTLILCPKNLVKMWDGVRMDYGLRATVMSTSIALDQLPNLRRHRLVIIDESHNFRNPEGKTYRAIQEYIQRNDSKCVLLSATPYNKTYVDLSSQLRLFVDANLDLGIRPERYIRRVGELAFAQHQVAPKTIAAFEKSDDTDDWRDLMRLYMVRRTRTFIKQHYAKPRTGNERKYLEFPNGDRSYFPDRVPKTVKFSLDDTDPKDQYARLYNHPVVDAINALRLPRYGLGEYALPPAATKRTSQEDDLIDGMSHAGSRLLGYCRTNLFKRLESSGSSFILSIGRHLLRNYVYIHAIKNGLDLPIGTQDAELFDPGLKDEDAQLALASDDGDQYEEEASGTIVSQETFEQQAARTYARYSTTMRRRFRWIRPLLFKPDLLKDLESDNGRLFGILQIAGAWDPKVDAKLDALTRLVRITHPRDKVLVFTQFADTARYLAHQLASLGVKQLAGVTGESNDPSEMAHRFSPRSNAGRGPVPADQELRVLVATDVLSEGQNLQDCSVVVNYDLPWALIRLVQRAGRVDRIGQNAERILCYSFLPADGVENIINLRRRVIRRLRENAEVVGSDEAFFADDKDVQRVVDLYNERAGLLDDDEDTSEVDLASQAYQIWKDAIDADPKLRKAVESLPDVVYATRAHQPDAAHPEGVLAFVKTQDGNDALAYVDETGKSITESQVEILRLAACERDTPPMPRNERHHELVKAAVAQVLTEGRRLGGSLGRPTGARSKAYHRLDAHLKNYRGTLFALEGLDKAVQAIYDHPLLQGAVDAVNRQLNASVSDEALAELVIALWKEGRLVRDEQEVRAREPRIVCSMGLFAKEVS